MYLQVKPRPSVDKIKNGNRIKSKWQRIASSSLLNIRNYIDSFLRQSGIHGFCYLAKKSLTLIEKFFWLFLLITSFIFCVQNALTSIDRYYTKNTVVSLERDYYYWRSKTTGITICPMKRLNVTLFDEFCHDHGIVDVRKEEFYDFMEKLANSTYLNFQQIPEYKSTDYILDELQITSRDYMKLIYNLTGDASLSMDPHYRVRTEVDGQTVHTRQVLTEWGLCYMANTMLSMESTAKYMIYGVVPEEYTSEDAGYYEVPEASYFENDLVFNIKGFMSSMYIYIHSVYEVMNINRNLGFYSIPASCTIETMPIITEDHFKERTTLMQRKCRFPDESNLLHYPVYTKNMCLQECRLNLAYKFCQCIPHFYPNRINNPKPVCNYKQLKSCFPKHEQYLIAIFRTEASGGHGHDHDDDSEESLDFRCDCMDNCRDANIIITNALPVFDSSSLFGSLGVMINMRRYPTFRLKRQIIFTFTDLLVSIGGSAGLFLGFSVLGAIEIIYYFTLRLICYMLGYKI